MSDNENISACEVINNRTLNEKDVNKKNEQRFALTTETELDELVSNAQAQSTKTTTIYAVNIFKDRRHLNIININNIFILKQSNANLGSKIDKYW